MKTLMKTYEHIRFMEQADQGVESSIYNISTGSEHILALDERYCIWAWGKNDFRQVDPKAEDISKSILLPKRVSFVILIIKL